VPDGFESAAWAKLEAATRAVWAKTPVGESYEQLYRARASTPPRRRALRPARESVWGTPPLTASLQCCEDLVLHKLGGSLYTKVVGEIDAHVAAELTRLAAEGTPDAVAFLAVVDALWTHHTAALLTLRALFTVLDRSYVLQTPGLRPLWDVGLAALRRGLTDRPALLQRLVGGLLAAISRERDGGGAVARPLLKSLLRLLAALGLYADAFELPFLAATAAFFAADAAAARAELPVAGFLAHAERRLGEESERCAAVLEGSTRRGLLAACEKALVGAHAGWLLEHGFGPLMDGGAGPPHLARLYTLLARVGATDALRAALVAYVKTCGTALVADPAKDGEMVEALLALKARLDAVHAGAFQANEAFGHALKDAFENVVNARANRPAELVAKYLDGALRAGAKVGGGEELEALLDRVLALFRCISGKDVFEAFYKKDLAKRLLLGRSASVDAERSMVAKLKAECGAQFTSKLEGMFKDVDISRDVAAAFKASAAAGRLPPGVEVGVSVLTAGFWPTYPPCELSLPAQVAACTDAFSAFYLAKHSGRRLAWLHGLGTLTLKAWFAGCGARELLVSLPQAAVLLLFNDCEALALSDLLAGTRLEDGELRRTLQSLACGKVRILTKTPRGKDVGDGDTFAVNDALNEPRFRIKVNAIQARETPEEAADTAEKVFQDRQYQIDAAIVRVMKARKTMGHQALVAELMQQLRFPVRREDIKKRIESLIEREYLERDKSAREVFNYLA